MLNIPMHMGFSQEILIWGISVSCETKKSSDLDGFSHDDRFWWPQINQKKIILQINIKRSQSVYLGDRESEKPKRAICTRWLL